MLGSTVLHRLRAITCLAGRWRAPGRALSSKPRRDGPARNLFRLGRYDYVINCIGVLKSAIDERGPESIERAIRVNALFPHELPTSRPSAAQGHPHLDRCGVLRDRPVPYTEQRARSDRLSTDDEGPRREPRAECSQHPLFHRRPRRAERGLVEWYLRPRAIGRRIPRLRLDARLRPCRWRISARVIAGRFDALRAAGHVVHFAPNPALSKADFLRLRDGRRPPIERRPTPGARATVCLLHANACRRRHAAEPARLVKLLPELMPNSPREVCNRS